MLEKILKLYTMAMIGDVRSPLPHLYGPPGCGKSSVVDEAARIIGCKLHIINVSRLSPLETEGVQMPLTTDGETRLEMLLATFWNELNEGDIVLLDEFLRGFPEVYNALLDILTSRRVGKHVLPKVFIIAASNSTVAYDKALEDRLLHIPVPDPRKLKKVKQGIAQRVVDELGLMPVMRDSVEMHSLLDNEVLPMYDCLDTLGQSGNMPAVTKGQSLRKLIGMAQLREVQSAHLNELISTNNLKALGEAKFQFVFLLNGKKVNDAYEKKAQQLKDNPKLTEIQRRNIAINLQLIEMEKARNERGIEDGGDDRFIDDVEP